MEISNNVTGGLTGTTESYAYDVNAVSPKIDGDYYEDFYNYTYDYSAALNHLPLDEVLPTALFYGIVGIVGLLGNVLVILAIAKFPHMRSITNAFLLSLASADLLIILICVPVKDEESCQSEDQSISKLMENTNEKEINAAENNAINISKRIEVDEDSQDADSEDDVDENVKPRRRKRKRASNKSAIESDTEDELPLSVIAGRPMINYEEDLDDSANDVLYKPNAGDINSTDSEFSSNISSDEKAKIKEKQLFEKTLLQGMKQAEILGSKPNTTEKLPKQSGQRHRDITQKIEKIKEKTLKESVERREILTENEHRLDQILFSNGMERVKVKADGNCFFEAVLLSIGEDTLDAHTLRTNVCKHLNENMEEYIGFLLNKKEQEDEEEFVMDYMLQVESLETPGLWTSMTADFLPLALSNMYLRDVRIYTNKPDQPVIEVMPTLEQTKTTTPICLCYISLPNIIEHYDACRKQIISDEVQTTAQSHVESSGTLGKVDYAAQNSPIGDDSSPVKCTKKRKSPQKGTPKKTTPRKAAKFITPVKRKLTRKRKATPDAWKKNVRKRLHLSGKEYTYSSGKVVKSKSVQPQDCSKCKFKCSIKFSQEKREKIFDSFWCLESYERQKDFVCSMAEIKSTRTYVDENNQQAKKTRMISRRFFFYDEDGIRQIVCKKFFLATLNLGESYVEHALRNKIEGRFSGGEKRGKHIPHNKTELKAETTVKEHIESFPKVEGHYTRKDTRREFLGADLNITKMYELYKEKMIGQGESTVTLPIYRKIFNEHYNYSFHTPKKDQCNTCTVYYRKESDGLMTPEIKADFDDHQQRKLRARQEKEKDKAIAKSTTNTYVATFDLQSVLYTPCSMVSLMYYMRKLCCYNLSFYGLGSNRGFCYVWSEVDAKRGSCEVATCLRLHLLSLPVTTEHVIFYSDACGGQNRNQIIATCLLDTISTIDHIKKIDHKFLESGHTQMECDSMHSAIEFAKKKTAIYVPSQWDTVISMARRKEPYTVVPLKHYDIIDYKLIHNQRSKVSKTSESGRKVLWTKIRWIRFIEDEPEFCFIKYNLDEEFEKVRLFHGKRRQASEAPLPRRYKGKLPITAAKKRDLVNLCKTGVIPAEHHDYYKALPSSQSTKDALPQPDVLESENDTDNETV